VGIKMNGNGIVDGWLVVPQTLKQFVRYATKWKSNKKCCDMT